MEQPSTFDFSPESLIGYQNFISRKESKSAIKDFSQKIKSCFCLLLTAPFDWFLQQRNKRLSYSRLQATNQTWQSPRVLGFINMYQSLRSKCVATIQTLQSLWTMMVICVQSLVSFMIAVWLMSFSVLMLLAWLRVDFEEFASGQKLIPFIMVLTLTVMAVIPFCLQAFYQEHAPH